MKLIASADENWGIGCNQQLLVRIPDDLRYFRELTTGKVVVMGRKTRESLPGGILSDRVNIVLSKDRNYQIQGAAVVHSMDELNQECRQYVSDDIFVMGGESIYRQLLDCCDTAYITKIDFAYTADAYFPNLDAHPEWELVARSEEQTYFDLIYHFQKYKKKGGNHGYNR